MMKRTKKLVFFEINIQTNSTSVSLKPYMYIRL